MERQELEELEGCYRKIGIIQAKGRNYADAKHALTKAEEIKSQIDQQETGTPPNPKNPGLGGLSGLGR